MLLSFERTVQQSVLDLIELTYCAAWYAGISCQNRRSSIDSDEQLHIGDRLHRWRPERPLVRSHAHIASEYRFSDRGWRNAGRDGHRLPPSAAGDRGHRLGWAIKRTLSRDRRLAIRSLSGRASGEEALQRLEAAQEWRVPCLLMGRNLASAAS